MIDICIPVYERIEPPTFVSFMMARLPSGGRNLFVEWEEPDIVKARNALAGKAVQSKNVYSLWVDSDIRFPENGPAMLAEVLEANPDVAVVTGMYRGRTSPHALTCFRWYDGEEGSGYVEFNGEGRTSPQAIDACGAGFMMVRNEVFKKGANFDREPPFSEDISFCRKVQGLGYAILACPYVKCGHVAKTILEV